MQSHQWSLCLDRWSTFCLNLTHAYILKFSPSIYYTSLLKFFPQPLTCIRPLFILFFFNLNTFSECIQEKRIGLSQQCIANITVRSQLWRCTSPNLNKSEQDRVAPEWLAYEWWRSTPRTPLKNNSPLYSCLISCWV